jgi:hypothetical protein
MLLRQRQVVEWVTSVALNSGETRNVEIGNVLSAEVVHADSGCSFITFGIISSHTLTFEIQGDLQMSMASADVLVTIPVLAATYMTPYDLPAPHNQTGYCTITRPYLRVRMIDTATAQHTYTRLYVKAWG